MKALDQCPLCGSHDIEVWEDEGKVWAACLEVNDEDDDCPFMECLGDS